MSAGHGEPRIKSGWWTVILIAVLVSLTVLVGVLFSGSLTRYVTVTLDSDRAGLVMESGGKVKMRGIQVGRVENISGGQQPVRLKLQIDPDQIKYIPANVQARIAATTAFGAKYVELVYPEDPSPQRLSAGAVLQSQNVTTEVNTVFQNLVGIIQKVDPAKLNAVLTALAQGVRGQGERIGEATTDANQVLLQLNPRSEAARADWRALQGFSETYSAAAQDILATLSAASTTSATIVNHRQALDALLLNVAGFSRSGVTLLSSSKDNLIRAVNLLDPTTNLLLKYNPELTCLLVGGKTALDAGQAEYTGGGNGKSLVVDAALLLGDDPYRYPDNLPINGAKGGPGGKPGCGSLPDVAKDFPVRQLITNTGWGTGLDVRPNPGIGFPGYANYLPVTRGVPEPPSIRYPGPPAPGPIPYPGAPPYGAPQYGPDGTPLYPGVPPPVDPGSVPPQP
jgi:phospholipid/cholesterol/gamma-HCH transport system substrate-binding protein